MPETNSYKIPAIIILVIAVLGCVWLIFTPKENTEAPNEVLNVATSTIATSTDSVRIDKTEEETAQYQIEVNIPQITNVGNVFALQSINKQIKQNIDASVKDFKDQIENIQAESSDTITAGEGNIPKHTMIISVSKTQRVNDKYFVIELKNYSYISGAAHPFTATMTLNFDMKMGTKIELENLYKDQTTFLQAVSTYSRNTLSKKLDPFFQEGIEPVADNFRVFTIEDGALRFVFDQYQVAPYAAGEQEVVIPASNLSGLMKIAL